MYLGINNSPQTLLPYNISANDTSISVLSVDGFPAGPNLATIGSGDNAELIRYVSVSESALIGCERGFYNTTAAAWPAGTKIARYYSAYDADIAKSNIEDLESRKANTSDLGDLALLDTVDNSKIASMPANTIKGNNLSSAGSPDDLTVDETVKMIFGGLSTETTPAPVDTDRLISEITRSSVVSRVLVTFGTIKNYILSTLFNISTGHDHNGSNSKKVSGSDLASVVPVSLGGTNAATSSDARSNLNVAPNDAEYVVATADNELGNGLVLTAGSDIAITKNSVNSSLTISVDNPSNITIDFLEASSLSNVSTGESLSILFGKVKKFFNNLASVATSGSYNDLLNKPTLATVATSGSYSDLSNKPTLATVATSGSYSDLIDEPTLATVATSGSYNDLLNKPTLGTLAAKGYNEATITLTSAGWSSKSQTVSVPGMTSTSPIPLYGPTPTESNRTAYFDADVFCSAQGLGTLTFKYTSSTAPTSDISVNLMFF
jgi:hypothetical protein